MDLEHFAIKCLVAGKLRLLGEVPNAEAASANDLAGRRFLKANQNANERRFAYAVGPD